MLGLVVDGQRAAGEPETETSRGSEVGYEQRFDEIVAQTLETAIGTGTLLYLFFTLLHPVYFDPPELYLMLLLALTTTLALAGLWWGVRQGQVSDRMAQPVVMAGLLLLLFNALAGAGLRPSPEVSIWLALVALAGGLLLLSREWFATLAAIVILAWGWVAYRAPPDPGWTSYAWLILLAAIVLAAATLASRRRSYRDLIDREHRLRQANQELDRARKEAQRAGELQSRFMASVSHDVRTPAAAIVAEARNLQTAEIDEAHSDSLATIEASARHLVRMIEDILDIAKAEAGELSIQKETFELERVLHESLDMVANDAREKGLEMTSTIGDDVPAAVETDPHRLQQILGNLLSNAVKFTPEGRVVLSVEQEARDPLVLRFAVEDTGIGIPEDRRDELFKAFSRTETQPDIEGTGLGLAICKGLVESLGGEIGVESEPGEGSTFWFTLPMEAAETEDLDDPEGPIRLTGRTAWLVGAEGFPAAILARWGLEIETMPGIGFVEEALTEERRPSLIVLDLVTIQAPEDFLAERVRAWREQGIPVLVAKAPGRELAEIEQIPGPGLVVTPSVSEEELRRAVTESLRQTGQARPSSPMSDPDMAREHPLEILIVEDSPVNRRLVTMTLEGLGYDPEPVERAEQALELLETEAYDLVFLDLGLPGMSGAEFAQQVNDDIQDPPRIVALTGHTDEGVLDEARRAGVAAVLTKPADFADLRAQVQQTSRQRGDGEGGG